jgi:hypothetical protein
MAKRAATQGGAALIDEFPTVDEAKPVGHNAIAAGEDVWLDDPKTDPPSPPPAPPSINASSSPAESKLSADNKTKLSSAIKHLEKLFFEAAGPQVENRRFNGFVEIQLAFQDGQCLSVNPAKWHSDRVQRPMR